MKADVNISRLAKRLTVKVRLVGMKQWTLRLKLGMILVRFGIWITGMNFEYLGFKEVE